MWINQKKRKMARKGKRMMKLSFSTLSIPCNRALWQKLQGKKEESIKAPETEEGIEKHKLFRRAIETGEWEQAGNEIEKKWYPPCEYERYEIERKIEIRIKKHILIGQIDAILYSSFKNEIMVIEAKSESLIIPRTRKQLRYYIFYLLLQDPTKSYFAGVYFLNWGTFELIRKKPYTEKDLTFLKYEIEKDIVRAERIRDSTSEPNPEPSSYCLWCPYPFSCPEYPFDKSNIDKIYQEYLKLKGKLKACETLLKSFCKKNNVFLTNGEEKTGFFPTQTLKIDKTGLLQYCKEQGIPISLLFNPDTQVFKNMCKENEDLTHFVEIVEKPKWGTKKEGKNGNIETITKI